MEAQVVVSTLKRLSHILSAVQAGERFVITRHKQPVAELTATGSEALHVGSRSGRGELRPVLQAPTGGRYLAVLRDDRADDK